MNKKMMRYFLVTSVFVTMNHPVFSTTETQQSKTCTEINRKEDANKGALLNDCEQLTIISKLNNGKSYGDVDEPKRTIDNKVTCVSKGGYTLDYDYCVKVRGLYNSVIMAEQGMFAQQKIRITESNNKQNAEVAKAQAEGDLQNAALKASKERAEQNSAMLKEQAWAYKGVVASFTVALSGWPAKGPKKIKALCGTGSPKKEKSATEQSESGNLVKFQTEMVRLGAVEKATDATAQKCEELVASRKGALFSNDDARTQFWLTNGQFAQKAAEAMRLAGINDTIADKTPKPDPDEDETVTLDPCVVDPSRPECKTPGPRRPTSPDIASGTMDFGSLGGSQAFDMGTSSGADLSGPSDSPAGSGSETVASVASPFEKEAKEATGILNPAAAASISAGSQNSPAGGGGGGAGGGGGGGGLDDDLQGVNEEGNKEPEITTTKVSSKSAKGGGGGGFQAIKSMDKEKDPYAGIFGAKDAAGGIEEDRSIASDIDGAASELFQKISKRYGQVQQDKRIEGQKLE